MCGGLPQERPLRHNRHVSGLGENAVTARVWDEQSLWSQAADRLKTGITRARTGSLVLGIAGSLLGTAASQTMPRDALAGKVLAFAAALSAALVPLLASRAAAGPVRDWTRLRAMSEAVKTEVYTCLAGVSPYRGDDARRVLLDRVDALRAEAADLLSYTLDLRPVERTPPTVSDVQTYVDMRLEPQISRYYRPKAVEMGRRVRVVRCVELALALAGAVLGALSGALGLAAAAAWVAVAATAGTAVGAHGLASRYAYQQTEFARTADELRRVADRWSVEPRSGPAGDDAFVAHCEQIISVLNDTWMVKWTTD